MAEKKPMVYKKPFTWAQQKLIEIEVKKGIKSHLKDADAHSLGVWSMALALIVIAIILSMVSLEIVRSIDTDQLKAEIYQELGYEKVCVDWSKSECGCEIEMVSNDPLAYTMSCYSPFDHDYCIECIKEYSNFTGFKIINSEFWVRDNSDCTEWQWQPKECS